MWQAVAAILSAVLSPIGNGPVTPTRAAGPATASDPVAIYALVDAVQLLPDAQAPERVRIDGAFAIFGGRAGDFYRSPRRGSLYFELRADQAEKCVQQWRDLAAVAGKGEVVGIGSRWECRDGVAVQARDSAEPTWLPFPTGMGVRKVRNASYGPVQALQALPRPVAPIGAVVFGSDYRRLPFRRVTLRIENCRDSKAGDHYLFEIERAGGECFGSPLIAAGESHTEWQVWVAAEPGEQITWRARVVRDGLKRAPLATARFVARVEPQKERDR